MRIDREWKKKNSYDFAIEQKRLDAPDIYNLWEKVGLQSSKQWIDEY